MGGFGALRLGLDWCQVEAVMRMQGIRCKDRAQRLAELKVMEDAALAELAEMDQLRGG